MAGRHQKALHSPTPAPTVTATAERFRSALSQHQCGRLAEAEAEYRGILSLQPDHAHALHLLGILALQHGRMLEAVGLMRRAADLDRSVPDFLTNLAAALWKAGQYPEALERMREAVRLFPRHAEAHHNLGVVLEEQGKLDEARALHQRAVELKPRYVQAHDHLGNVLRQMGKLDEAEACHRRAIALQPGYADGYANLACTLAERADQQGVISSRRQVAELRPRSPRAGSELLLSLHYADGIEPTDLLREHVAWAERHFGGTGFQPVARGVRGADHGLEARATLRVGYVSGDFRRHPVARLFAPILAGHDERRVEVFCYSATQPPDDVTQALRRIAGEEHWRDIAAMDDSAAAEVIRRDRVDVLVDLGGHMDNTRLTLFARRPAPVQVTYLGYPDTTGLPAMDYRITDAWHDPPGLTEHLHTEQLVRIDGGCWCCAPEDEAPPVNDPPRLASGRATFAALNRLVKVTPAAIRLWARVLQAVPQSRLMVLVGRGCEGDKGIVRLFESNGIDPSRLLLVGRRSRADYLRLYQEADIALDTFPYNGHTTTLDAAWMGVPTVSLAGVTHVQRAGLSVMSALGLADDLVGHSAEHFVEKAVSLAADVAKLADLRRELRGRMAASPLCDGPRVARALEDAYCWMSSEARARYGAPVP